MCLDYEKKFLEREAFFIVNMYTKKNESKNLCEYMVKIEV